MKNKNEAAKGKRPAARPSQPLKRPASKEEAIQQEVGTDPAKAAELLREILKGRK